MLTASLYVGRYCELRLGLDPGWPNGKLVDEGSPEKGCGKELVRLEDGWGGWKGGEVGEGEGREGAEGAEGWGCSRTSLRVAAFSVCLEKKFIGSFGETIPASRITTNDTSGLLGCVVDPWYPEGLGMIAVGGVLKLVVGWRAASADAGSWETKVTFRVFSWIRYLWFWPAVLLWASSISFFFACNVRKWKGSTWFQNK